MRSTIVVGYAFATGAFFWALNDALHMGLGPWYLGAGFLIGLVSAWWKVWGQP